MPTSVRHEHRIEPVWDELPELTKSLVGISRGETRLSFRREKNSHRGLRDFEGLAELIVSCPNQEAIAEIGHLQSLEFLYIDDTRATDMSPLAECGALRHLTIKGATQLTSLEWIRDLPQLDSLLIENFKKITDISPIAAQTSLKALGVEGSMWTRQKVDSFIPLSGLEGLEALFITNCKPTTHGLMPLYSLHNLRHLEAPAFYTEDEFSGLEKAIPQLMCSWFDQIRKHGSIKAAINSSINTK